MREPLVQMRSSQCLPGKGGQGDLAADRQKARLLLLFNHSKFYSRIQQKCWGNRTVTEKATCIWGAQRHVSFVSGWMCEAWEDEMTAFLQRPQFLQRLTRNKYLYYLPEAKKWSRLFPEYINVSCSKSTVHSVSLAEKTLSNPARQAMRGERLDGKERRKARPARHPQSTRKLQT